MKDQFLLVGLVNPVLQAQLKLAKFVKIAQNIVIFVKMMILPVHLVSQAMNCTKVIAFKFKMKMIHQKCLKAYVGLVHLTITELVMIALHMVWYANIHAPTLKNREDFFVIAKLAKSLMNSINVSDPVAKLMNGMMELDAMHSKQTVTTLIVQSVKEVKAGARLVNLNSFLMIKDYALRWTLTAHILMDLLVLLLVA